MLLQTPSTKFDYIVLLLFLCAPCLWPHQIGAAEPSGVFKLHLSVEPLTLNPTQQKGSGAMYLTNALHLPLFFSELDPRFRPGVLQSCRWLNKTKLACKLSQGLKWSNGKDITATDVIRTFDYFKDPKQQTLRPDLVRNIKSLSSKNPLAILFELNQEEPRFQERLTSPLLAPIYETSFPKVDEGQKLITSGPYKIEKWESKRKITLAVNSFFKGHPQRPKVEFYFIPEDTTALMLYEKGHLDFLRRIPSAYMNSYENKKDFHLAPLVRFDYVGFGPTMEKERDLRMMLSQALQFEDWKQVLKARGRPGCFGIGVDLLQADPCLDFKKSELDSWKTKLKESTLPRLELHYSTLGGEDHKRSMEWLQSEWKKNLNLNVTVKGLDNALFQREMSENPPPLFRFGVSLDYLSCANALENFLNNPNSNLPFKKEPLLGIVEQLKKLRSGESEEKLCDKALVALLKENWIIPLGRIHISLLAKPEWKGWKLSALNYLDLSQLHRE